MSWEHEGWPVSFSPPEASTPSGSSKRMLTDNVVDPDPNRVPESTEEAVLLRWHLWAKQEIKCLQEERAELINRTEKDAESIRRLQRAIEGLQ